MAEMIVIRLPGKGGNEFINPLLLCPLSGMDIYYKAHRKEKHLMKLTSVELFKAGKFFIDQNLMRAYVVIFGEALRRQIGNFPPSFQRDCVTFARNPDTKKLRVVFTLTNPN